MAGQLGFFFFKLHILCISQSFYSKPILTLILEKKNFFLKQGVCIRRKIFIKKKGKKKRSVLSQGMRK